MNKIVVVIVAVVAVGGLFHFRAEQRGQLRKLQAAEAALGETSARAEYAEQGQASLRNEFIKLEAEKLSRAAAPQPAAAKSAPAPESAGSKLFRDPEMRAAMRKENLKALERTAKQIVNSNLIAELQLSPEQSATLKGLVLKKNESSVDLLMAMLSGQSTDAELAQVARAGGEQRDAVDAEIKALLGDEGFAAFSWHEDSLAERSRLHEYRRQFADAGAPLTSEQEDALLHAMHEERANFSFTHDFHDPAKFDPDRLAEIYSEENLNRFIGEMEQVNNRIIARAQAILGAEQAVQFAQFHRDHFERSKMTVKMTSALFPVRRKN